MRLERFGLHNGFHDAPSRSFPPAPPPDVAAPGSFVFAQWNIGGFCLGQGGAAAANTVARADAFRRQLGAVEADVFGLSEYAPQFAMGGKPASETVFGAYPHAAVGPRLGANGNAVISRRFPLSAVRVCPFPHRTQKRYLVTCEASIDGVRTTFAQTHLDLDADNRRLQFEELLRRFGNVPNMILAADFNEAGMDEFKPFEKVGFRLANGGAFGTFLTHRRRNTAFTPAIDNVLVKGFDILSVRTEDDSMILSDHRMLVCRLRAKGSPSKEGGM